MPLYAAHGQFLMVAKLTSSLDFHHNFSSKHLNIHYFNNKSLFYRIILLIATNHRVVAAQRQQRGLVAVTIRGSVLFYSSAI